MSEHRKLCVHVASNNQAQCVIGVETLCGPCAWEKIESLLKSGVHIRKLTGSVILDRCGHHPEQDHGATCRDCLTGLVGCGMMFHAHCALHGDMRTANLLGRTIKRLRVLHWQEPQPKQNIPHPVS